MKQKFEIEEKLVCTSEDYKIRLHECKRNRVDGNFSEDKEWLVEKNLLANTNNSFFAVPNILISSRHPWVPITNPTDHPRYIQKGEIIGSLTDPKKFFDKPSLLEEAEKMCVAAHAIKQLIDIQAAARGPTEEAAEQEDYGPKTAPVVIAYRNGKPRFCVDYRKLNAVTIPDEFPIPRQSEILASLSGAQVLSSLDALSGFTQLELDPEDVEKTAFRTHRGLFQFKRMPFGLRNSPSIFQCIMQNILSPYLWLFCLVYINNIVVYSKSYEDHIDHLGKVLEVIERAGITLSPSKCHLFYGSILLLGHKVSCLGLSTHAEKVKAIVELDRPRKLSQLQAFLGMVVYFSAFIPYYASICVPLF